MSVLKQMITKSPVHGRQIGMKTYLVSEDVIIVEGELIDDGYQTVFDLTGRKRTAGPIHHLLIRLLIQISSREITDAEAEMIHVPHEECRETIESVKAVIGLKIEGGFGKTVLNRIGGVKGCSHMTHLLTVMSQEVFQGMVVVQRMEYRPLPKTVSEIVGLERLVGSCRMWDEQGIKLRNIRDAINGRRDRPREK